MRIVVFVSLLTVTASCSSRSGPLEPPAIDSNAVAQRAMEQYDANSDGQLTKQEIATSALSLETWDANKDGGIDLAELQQRLQQYVDRGVGMISLQCFVRLNNRPLEGAQVTFEPEAFMADAIHPASGITESSGGTALSVAPEHRPDPALEGVQMGLYKVRITHPEINLPAKYNTETTLAFDVSPLENLQPPTFNLRR